MNGALLSVLLYTFFVLNTVFLAALLSWSKRIDARLDVVERRRD
jgi:hypothetical protein